MILARVAARVRALALTAGAACVLAPLAASAAEYRSVTVAAAVLYDGPSAASRRLFIAPRGMPVEVVSQAGAWIKVRDFEGGLAWIERAELGTQRTVIARGPFASVRAAPQSDAPVIFQADRGVVLELIETASATGWAHVRHRDGTEGHVRATDVWGM